MASTKHAIWIGVVCVALGFAWYTLRLVFDEGDVEQGSYGYYLLISSLVRNLPTHKMSSDAKALYSNRIGGSGPAYDQLYYCSDAESSDIVAFFDDYFKQRGFSAERFEWGKAYTREKDEIRLSVSKDEFCKAPVRLVHYSSLR